MNYMGEHVRIQKTFPGEEKGSKGYKKIYVSRGWSEAYFRFKKFGFFSPPPRLASQDFRMGEQF